ncbi:S1-C subfamily serine protease [Bradyrhizobium sp. USDA 4474]
MTAATIVPTRLRQHARFGLAALAFSAFSLFGSPAQARGPEGIADVAEKVIDAVVNISTSQTVEAKGGSNTMPQLPPGSPFEEFFDDFFKNRKGPGGGGKGGDNGGGLPHKTNSLGSGFIIDTSGVVVTNNHVIADADEINVILNDGTKIKAELVGVDKKTDLAVLKFQAAEAARLGEVWRLRQIAFGRLGGRDRQPLQPRRHGDGRHRLGQEPRHLLGAL